MLVVGKVDMTKDYTVQGRHVLAKKNLLLVMYELRDNKDKKVMCIYLKKNSSGTKNFYQTPFFLVCIAQLCPPVGSLANKRKKYKTNDTLFSIYYHI